MRKILYVEGNTDGTVGGSYFSLLFLTSGLDRKRFEPTVVFARENSLIPTYQSRGVRVLIRAKPEPTRLSFPGGALVAKAINFVKGFIVEPLRLARFLRRERVALLHLNNAVILNHTWMIGAWLARVPCITHERGINPVYKTRDHVMAGLLRAIIAISKAVEDNLVTRGMKRVVMIHNGLDPQEMRVTRPAAELRAALGIPAGKRLIGVVGNIKGWKGQKLVVQSVAALRDEFPDLVALLIGDAPPGDTGYRDELLALARENGIEDRIVITGYQQNVANYIDMLEIQLHTSTSPEPFGRVLLEAMALGKPLIASNGGAVPEIVVHGVTGLVFEPGSPDSLTGSLRQLLGDPARAAQMGVAGKTRLNDHFSVAANVRQTEALYDRILS
jgi:glycosyltransferase involved in cell wall biosynthesis